MLREVGVGGEVSSAVTYADVVAAAERIRGAVERTPLAHSRTLGAICGADVYVKFENLQFTASYKERGARNRLLQLPHATGGVVAASAGNFAQGVAHHATELGIPAAIVMPAATPNVKVARTSVLGAEVVKHGATFEAAAEHAAALAVERGWELLSAFDDPEVIAGQGTVAIEIAEDLPTVDVVVVPVGGGGLIAGMSVALRELLPSVEIVGVQSERFPGVHNLVSGAELPVGGTTIAEGVAVGTPGARAVEIIRECVDRVELVPEAMIEQAIGLYLEVEKTVAEGAGAVTLAELLARPERYAGRTVAVVLSGGNIDMRQLAAVNLRELVRSGRMSTFWVELDDRPGTLGRVTTLVGELGANIVEVTHRWLDPGVPARATTVEFTVETTDRDHLAAIVAGLADHGYQVRTAPPASPSP
jgi:threonine dehydratase